MTSTVPSVEPPTTTMYSRFAYRWSSTERMQSSIVATLMYDGVTTVMRGAAPGAARLTVRPAERSVATAPETLARCKSWRLRLHAEACSGGAEKRQQPCGGVAPHRVLQPLDSRRARALQHQQAATPEVERLGARLGESPGRPVRGACLALGCRLG